MEDNINKKTDSKSNELIKSEADNKKQLNTNNENDPSSNLKNSSTIINKDNGLEMNIQENKNPSDTIKVKPKKEIPIEKKPFNEFINEHLIPSLIEEFQKKGLEINTINLSNASRPIAGDLCWIIYCEIKETCNFWLSFEKDDISSLKSFSLSKSNQKPSVLESFLIDEKRITLKLIISRILQRLNGQKLIGIN